MYKGNKISVIDKEDGSLIIRLHNRFGFRWFVSDSRKDLYRTKLPKAVEIAFKCPIVI